MLILLREAQDQLQVEKTEFKIFFARILVINRFEMALDLKIEIAKYLIVHTEIFEFIEEIQKGGEVMNS